MEDRSELGDESIGGEGFTGHGRPARTFRAGRVCAESDCDTQLSIYNEADRCSLHMSPSTPRLRGKKIA